MKVNTKPLREHRHVSRRLRERYNLPLDHSEHQYLVHQIQAGHSLAFKHISNHRCIHLLEYKGQRIPFVYDSGHHRLVTALPAESHIAWQERTER